MSDALKPENDPSSPVQKPGLKTTEFWVSALTALALAIPSIMEQLPPEGLPYAILGCVVIVLGYVLKRGIVKASGNLGAAKVEAARVLAAAALKDPGGPSKLP